MQFESPCALTLDATSSKVPSIKELTRYEGFFGNLTVAVQRITTRADIKPDVDTRARGIAEHVVTGTVNHKVEGIAPMTVSGMAGRRVSVSEEFKGKPFKQEMIVVVRGQTIWELKVFHEGEAKQKAAVERMIRSLRIGQ